MFSSDQPITSLTADRLNRKSFAKQLAKAIISYKSYENFTIGLCGKWGSGKTSIINMVVEEIGVLTKEYEDIPIIVKFNPWNYSDRSQLINQFFHIILSEISTKATNERLSKVGSALQKYSEVFTYTEYIPVVGKYLGPISKLFESAGQSISELAQNKESIENLKEQVVESLKEQSQKIIVIIDDIDRLNNEQIRLIFQLVNCVAGFPNMIYILSFDRAVVVRALEDEQKCNGEEYLEKIIQVPFDVPETKKENIFNLLSEQLNSLWFDEIPCDSFESDYWNSVFNNCISPFINTIRDVNRIINVYRFKYGLLHGETNCIDLLAITVLQVCAPELFEWVKVNIGRLTGSRYGRGTTSNDQKKNEETIIKELEIITDNPKTKLKALQELFPKLSWITGGYCSNRDDENELRIKQKISCADRAPLYFRLSLEDIRISRSIVVDSIKHYDSDNLDKMFSSIREKGLASYYIKELNAFVNDIPENRKQLFIKKLICWQTMSFENEKRDFLSISPTFYCNECCWDILKTMAEGEVVAVLSDMIESVVYEQFIIVTDIIVEIVKSFGYIGNTATLERRIISENHLAEIGNKALVRIKKLSNKSFLFRLKKPWGMYCFWGYKEKESLQLHIQNSLQNTNNIPYYIFAFASTWTGGKTQGWNFEKKTIEEYITIENAYSVVFGLRNTEYFSSLEYGVKETTVAFYLWYNSELKEHNEFSKEVVDSIIPEWEKA